MKQNKLSSVVMVVSIVTGLFFPCISVAQSISSYNNDEMCKNELWNVKQSMWESVYIDSKFGNYPLKVSDLDVLTDFYLVYFSDEGLALVNNRDYKYGFVNTKGEIIIPFIYDAARRFYEGLAAVQKGSKWGVINTLGEVVVPWAYSYVENFSEGLACVQQFDRDTGDTKYGFVNNRGEIVVPVIYDCARPFSGGMAGVNKDGKWGFVDNAGNLIIPCKYDNCGDFYSDDFEYCDDNLYFWAESTDGRMGVSEGIYQDDGIYNYIGPFHEGIASFIKETVRNNHSLIEISYIDKTGKTVFHLSGYKNAARFNEGFARVIKKKGYDNVYGFIDKSGKEIIPCIYDGVSCFNNGLALVKSYVKSADEWGHEWNYIDKSGNIIKKLKSEKHKISNLSPTDAAAEAAAKAAEALRGL